MPLNPLFFSPIPSEFSLFKSNAIIEDVYLLSVFGNSIFAIIIKALKVYK